MLSRMTSVSCGPGVSLFCVLRLSDTGWRCGLLLVDAQYDADSIDVREAYSSISCTVFACRQLLLGLCVLCLIGTWQIKCCLLYEIPDDSIMKSRLVLRATVTFQDGALVC